MIHCTSQISGDQPFLPPPTQADSRDLSLTYELLYGCNMADTEQRMRLDPTTTMLTLTHLLPRCEYWLHVEVFSSGPAPVVSDECHVVMPAGQSEGTVFVLQ